MKYVLSSLLLCFTFVISAQSGFSRIYEMEISEWDRVQQVIRSGDQLILIVASSCELIDGDDCLNVISTNLDGEELWRIEKPAHQIEDEMDIAVLWNDHIYVATEDLTTVVDGQSGQIQVFQIDLDGNIVETHVLFNVVPEIFKFKGFTISNNQFTASSILFIENNSHIEGKLSFYDTNLDWLGQKILSPEGTQFAFQDIIPTADGGYLLAIIEKTIVAPSQKKLQKLTSDGIVEWERNLEGSEFITGTSIETNEEGDIFIIYEINQNFFTNPEKFLRVERLDSEGNEIWVNDHFIAGAEYRRYERMILTDEDEMIYIGCGEVMGQDNGFSGLVAKVNSIGDLVWEKAYRDADLGGGQTHLFSGLPLDNGEFIIAGELRNSNQIFRNDPWLLRANTNGCIYTENCDDLDLITPTRNLTPALIDNFSITPTLVQDQLTIHLENETQNQKVKIKIISASGQLVQEIIAHDFPYDITTSNLSIGFYFLEVLDKEDGREVFKFIKQ